MQGIYMIRNKLNNKMYIGKSINIEGRWGGHKKGLKEGTHNNQHLLNSWNKYSEDNFEFSVIEEVEASEQDEHEIYWIAHYKSFDPSFGFNKTLGGDGGIPTEEVRRKQSKSHKGKKLSKETLIKLSQLNSGPNNAMYGKKGELCPSYGLTRSDEFKEKLRQANLGNKHSEESKKKMSRNSLLLSDEQVIEILKLIFKENNDLKEVAKINNVSLRTIQRIKHNERYTHINREEFIK